MTISHFDWQLLGYAALFLLAASRVWGFRRQWHSGVLDYGYNRVERTTDPKRFRFWLTADVIVCSLIFLGAANWIARQ
jgi:hypothetical protein